MDFGRSASHTEGSTTSAAFPAFSTHKIPAYASEGVPEEVECPLLEEFDAISRAFLQQGTEAQVRHALL